MTKKNKGQREVTEEIKSPQKRKSPACSVTTHAWLWDIRLKKRKAVITTTFLKKTLASAYFPTQKYAVSWAMKSLTAEFGMGSGIPSSLWTPRKYSNV